MLLHSPREDTQAGTQEQQKEMSKEADPEQLGEGASGRLGALLQGAHLAGSSPKYK